MSKRRRTPPLPSEAVRLLKESGVPWRIDLGTRHYKLIVADRLITVLPRGGVHPDGYHGRADKNVMAHVRRAIRENTNV